MRTKESLEIELMKRDSKQHYLHQSQYTYTIVLYCRSKSRVCLGRINHIQHVLDPYDMYTGIIPYPRNDYCTYSNQTEIISRRIARKCYNILSWNTSQQERHSATSVASGLLLLGCSHQLLRENSTTNHAGNG
jgi:hypothetical protein